jgi:hypothetical protein
VTTKKTAPSDDLARVGENFAHDDARDDTDVLSRNFIPPPYLSIIPEGSSRVVVGRYGTGKTALIQELAKGGFEPTFRTEIFLVSDIISAELHAANRDNDYATFAKSLVYLRLIYDYAVSVQGKLATGPYASLMKELKGLKLNPYQDVIARFFSSVQGIVAKTKKIEVPALFGFETHPAPLQDINMRRYRELCALIEPVVRGIMSSNRHIVMIDAIDPQKLLLEETSSLMGAMIRWLKEETQRTDDRLRFLIALPFPVYHYFQAKGIHIPHQDIFFPIEWTNRDLRQLVLKRVQEGLGDGTNPEDWLRQVLGVEPAALDAYTFGKPRDYIKIIRKCIETRRAKPSLGAADCWLEGKRRYSFEVLHWLGSEWELMGGGFENLRPVLKELPLQFEEGALDKAIKNLRKEGFMKERANRAIIDDLKRWQLVVPTTGKKFKLHPTLLEEELN